MRGFLEEFWPNRLRRGWGGYRFGGGCLDLGSRGRGAQPLIIFRDRPEIGAREEIVDAAYVQEVTSGDDGAVQDRMTSLA